MTEMHEMTEKRAVSFQNVGFSYPSGEEVLRDVSLTAEFGEMVALMGANGSGKSTVALLAMGLLKPTSGKVAALGCEPENVECSTGLDVDAQFTADAHSSARSKTGFVMQNPEDQIVKSLVEDEVAFGPENLGLESDEVRRRVSESLDAVGLSGFELRDVNALSGGELQRVAVADALATHPEVVIFDEPTSMQDASSREWILAKARELADYGACVLLVTHSAEEALFCDRVLALEGKRVALDMPCGDRQECLSKLRKLGLARADDGGAWREKATAASCEQKDSYLAAASRKTIMKFDMVSYSYLAEKADVLQDVSLELSAGDVLAVTGPNGSGKSTLLRLMNGLLRPSSGTVEVCGRTTTSRSGADHARRHVGLTMQFPERQLFAATVFDDIAFGLRNVGITDAAELKAKATDALEAVGLDPQRYMPRSPAELSLGEQRLVALAGIIVMRPDILALDEPCAGLDARGHASLIALLRRLSGCGTTIVFATHDEQDVRDFATRELGL